MYKKKCRFFRVVSMFLFVCLLIMGILDVGIMPSYASEYVTNSKNTGGFDEETIKGTLNINYNVSGKFYEESTGGLKAKGFMDKTETISVDVDVHIVRHHNFFGTAKEYTYSVNPKEISSHWDVRDYTTADGLPQEAGSWVHAAGSVKVNISGQQNSISDASNMGYDSTIPISIDAKNWVDVSMVIDDFWDELPDWSVLQHNLSVSVLDVNLSFEVPSFRQFNIDWDEGVDSVQDYCRDVSNNPSSDNTLEDYEKNTGYLYVKDRKAYTFIHLKEGYELDYIEEGGTRWNDSEWNSTEKRWDNSWTLDRDRSIYIHTKRKTYSLDLNATYINSVLSGLSDGGYDLGTCDVYVYDDSGNVWDSAVGVKNF